ncbi:TPA: O102 family O-antigen polymerase, partial [Escherichia coli]|nr:O102 family O-antigen polymerase [Escherichia coli]
MNENQINKQRSGKYLTAFLCCAFLSINSLAINPAYIYGAGLLSIIIMLIFVKAKISKFSMVTIIFAFAILLCQVIGIYYKTQTTGYPEAPNYITPFLFFYSMVISVGVNEVFMVLNYDTRIKCYKNFLMFFVMFMFLELITRVIIGNLSEGILYAFKKSLFYFDSNFTALIDISILGFLLFLKNNKIYNFKYTRYITYILLFLTMSRAAMVTLLAMLYVLNNKAKIGKRSALVFLFVICVFIYMSISYLFENSNYSNIDGSFNSKFYIISQAFEFYTTQSLMTHMFGVGLGNTEQLLGIFAHNIYVTLVLEFGFIGSFLFITFIFYSLKKTNFNSLYIWLPVCISGISLFGAYSPFLFILNAVIYNE